jgi:signal peptidase I
MNSPSQIPPPIAQHTKEPLGLPGKLLIAMAACVALCVVALVGLRVTRMLIPFSVPTSVMSPALKRGDHIFCENFTYKSRRPVRGEIAVFKGKGLGPLTNDIYFVKRIAGEPGDSLRMAGGRLFVNGKDSMLQNVAGPVIYENHPITKYLPTARESTVVPTNSCFLLDDNPAEWFDSRFFGPVPFSNIVGRVIYRYWPPGRIGPFK